MCICTCHGERHAVDFVHSDFYNADWLFDFLSRQSPDVRHTTVRL
jgi:hypothetical protein